jgi:hypothetical protein
MRRTRDNNWHLFLFLLPAIAAGFGIHYLVKKNKTTTVATTTTDKALGYRTLASDSASHDVATQIRHGVDRINKDQNEPEKDLAEDSTTDRTPAKFDDSCTSFELRGDGMAETHVSNEEWAKVMDLFHDSKAGLQTWLTAHKAEFPGGLVKWMSAQVEGAKLQRPPLAEEPDLNWRGIGVIAHSSTDADSVPLLRVGGGFIKLAVTDSKRASFELTRLLAEAWNPCDMPTGARGTWQPLLKCMGTKEQDWDYKKSCALGSQTEAGWAVATAVAVSVSPPGCMVPAFRTASVSQCVKKTAWLEEPKVTEVRLPASTGEKK